MPVFNRIDSYILKEIRKPFVFSFFIFASLWIINLLIRILNLAISKGVDWEPLFKLILYYLPGIIVMSLPMAVLMGTMLGLSRMNNDSEIIALKAAGVSTVRLVTPIFVFAFLISCVAYFLNEQAVPRGRFLAERVYINEISLKKPLPKVAKNIFFDGGSKFKLYIRDYDDVQKKMLNITMFQFKEGFPTLTQAKEASIEEGNLWVFRSGLTSYFDKVGKTLYQVEFDQWTYPVSDRFANPIAFSEKNLSPKEMNMDQLKEAIAHRKSKGVGTREFETQYYYRSSFPFASAFLVLVGVPLAVRPTRGGKSSGFGLGLFVMIVYYVLLSTGRSLGGNGTLDPMVANWMANTACFFLGLFLIYQSRR